MRTTRVSRCWSAQRSLVRAAHPEVSTRLCPSAAGSAAAKVEMMLETTSAVEEADLGAAVDVADATDETTATAHTTEKVVRAGVPEKSRTDQTETAAG